MFPIERETPLCRSLCFRGKIASLPAEKGWLLDVLRDGRLPWGCPEDNQCPVDALFNT